MKKGYKKTGQLAGFFCGASIDLYRLLFLPLGAIGRTRRWLRAAGAYRQTISDRKPVDHEARGPLRRVCGKGLPGVAPQPCGMPGSESMLIQRQT